MGSTSRFILPILLLAAPLSVTLAADSAPASDGDDVLDEVHVEGRRGALTGIRQEMVRLEDLFYARYNELNTNDLFDIHCTDTPRTGTLIRRRYCRAVYEARAFETEGREHLMALQHQAGSMQSLGQPMEWIPPHSPFVAIERQRAEFRRNMLKVTSDHPELVGLLRERAGLAERYESLRRETFDLHPPADE
jgi:hypothetical protein